MGEKPIIFSAPMVRAILDGRKSQTRRVLKPRGKLQPSLVDGTWSDEYVLDPGNAEWLARDVPYAVGDVLWVRETWQIPPLCDIQYRATDTNRIGHWNPDRGSWRSPIHMPRAYSRISLKVTGIKVERLQDISRDDVIAEGITERDGAPLTDCVAGWHEPFAALWESIHGPGSWEQNPWVVAISFERLPPQGGST